MSVDIHAPQRVGEGAAVIDPHGDLANEWLTSRPAPGASRSISDPFVSFSYLFVPLTVTEGGLVH